MGLIKCPECGKEISDKSLYCLNCGCPVRKGEAPKKTYSTCPNCGNPMEQGSTVCSECGARLISVNGTPVNGAPTHVGKISVAPVKQEKASANKTNSEILAIASMVCGIIGVCLSFVYIGILPVIAGFVLAIIAFCMETPKKWMAWTGVITSILGLGVFAVVCSANIISGDDVGTETSKTTAVERQKKDKQKNQKESDSDEANLEKIYRNPDSYIGEEVSVEIVVEMEPLREEGATEEYILGYQNVVNFTVVRCEDNAFQCSKGDVLKVTGTVQGEIDVLEGYPSGLAINGETVEVVETASDSDISLPEGEGVETGKEEFIASCQEFDYKSIARNPDEYTGKNFKVNVEIFNTASGSWYSDYDTYYKAYTDDGSGIYFDHMIYLIDRQDTEADSYLKILDGDIVTIYGTFNGMTETENGITGESGEEVCIDIYYAELISE